AGALNNLGIAAVDHLADHLEGAEAGPVRRDLGRRAPGAIGVEIEIVARRDIAVDPGEVDAEGMTGRGGWGGVEGGRGGAGGRGQAQGGGESGAADEARSL